MVVGISSILDILTSICMTFRHKCLGIWLGTKKRGCHLRWRNGSQKFRGRCRRSYRDVWDYLWSGSRISAPSQHWNALGWKINREKRKGKRRQCRKEERELRDSMEGRSQWRERNKVTTKGRYKRNWDQKHKRRKLTLERKRDSYLSFLGGEEINLG